MPKQNLMIQARKSKGMTQGEVASKAELSTSAYNHIENGNRLPSVKCAKRIGSVLDVDWTKFFDDIE